MKVPKVTTLSVLLALPSVVSAGFWGPIVEYVDDYFSRDKHDAKTLAEMDPRWFPTDHTKFFGDWSGFVKEAGNTREASADIELPKLLPRRWAEQNEEVAGEAWVGIDGYSCREAAFRAGVTWKQVGGRTAYIAWSQWLPMPRREFGLDIGSDHELGFTVRASGNAEGVATIVNHSTNETIKHVYKDQPSLLCREDAGWIVSRVSKPVGADGKRENYPFAKYEKMRFDNPVHVSEGDSEPRRLSNPRQMRMGKLLMGFWRSAEESSCALELLTRDIKCKST